MQRALTPTLRKLLAGFFALTHPAVIAHIPALAINGSEK
jgi:hypothetical protein